jgi:nitrogen fixation NifU-like protein
VSDALALYQATIVDHDRHPRNHGPLAGADRAATVDNPLCGDVVTIELRVDAGVVAAAAWTGRGCALARAAGSMLTVALAGLDATAAHARLDALEALVCAAPDAPVPDGLGELAAFAGVRRFASRRGCVLIAVRAARACLSG